METTQILLKFREHVHIWKVTADNYELSDLKKKPKDSSWSLGQVCMHVIMAHEKFFMTNAQKCLQKKGTKTRRGKNIMGKFIFLLKSIPPVRLKMPKSVAFEPPQPESKEQLHQRFDQMVAMMEEVERQLADADLTIKTRHPALGMMNALEWFKGAEMHIRHHFMQMKRLEKFLEQA
ncbi:MAG: DinB family protein [Saprospirales bacterium]|nr:MAG: DinB family protein [Saprospirales bacterium]